MPYEGIANGETLPEEVLKALTDKSVIKKAFNVNFERVCLSVYLRRNYPEIASFEDAVVNYIDPESWQCDMIHSRYLGMMSSLDDMGRLLRLKEKKMSEGKDLIKFFCTLHEDKNGNLFFHDKSDAPTKWKTFKEYNRRDVEVKMKIQHLLSEVPVPDFIWEEFYIDQRINDRGILVDTAFAAKAVELDSNVKKELFPKLQELTGLDNPNSPAQMKDWLKSKGIEIDSLNKKALSDIMETADDSVKEVLRLYQQLSKSSVSKYHTMLNAACKDGRARGAFSFYGANRTGRFAGRLIQLQNLPQNHLDNLAEMQSIIQGESIEDLAKRLASVTDMNETSSIRNARTMITSAQNAGREDQYRRAESMGIKLSKCWIATLDHRTRASHIALDGEIIKEGETFSNGLEYPGDMNGDPREVYNCRCRTIAIFEDQDFSKFERHSRLGEMSYEQWKNSKK